MLPIMGLLAQQGLVVYRPEQIPNLSLWYNPDQNTAAKVTLNGSNEVTRINDLSSAGHPADSFGAKYPDYATNVLNGLNAVQYTAANSDNLDINPISWAQNQGGFTLFVVAQPTSVPATQFPLVVTDANLGIQWSGTNWQVGAAGATATTSTATNDTSRAHIYGMIFNGAGIGNAGRLRFRYDRVEQTLTYSANVGIATSSTASTMYFCGNNRNTPKSYMSGYLFEVMVWLRGLSNSEILGTENYIRSHWGI